MSRNELFTSINSLCRYMNDTYNINCGGCCYVAAVLAEFLEKYNIQYYIYELYCPCHFVVRVSDRYLNRGDFFIGSNKRLLKCDSTELYFKYYHSSWNNMYSKRWNLIVYSKIKSLFKKYENSRT